MFIIGVFFFFVFGILRLNQLDHDEYWKIHDSSTADIYGLLAALSLILSVVGLFSS